MKCAGQQHKAESHYDITYKRKQEILQTLTEAGLCDAILMNYRRCIDGNKNYIVSNSL